MVALVGKLDLDTVRMVEEGSVVAPPPILPTLLLPLSPLPTNIPCLLPMPALLLLDCRDSPSLGDCLPCQALNLCATGLSGVGLV